MRVQSSIVVVLFMVSGLTAAGASGAPEQADPPGDIQEDRPLAPDEPERLDPAPEADREARPGDAEDQTALDVLRDHQQTSVAYDLFGEEFADALDGVRPLAFFVPVDGALDALDLEALSGEEVRSLYERHITTGLAAEEPIAYIDSFTTEDGRMITVTVEEDGTVVLDDIARIIEIIPVTNGIVYLIDTTLDW